MKNIIAIPGSLRKNSMNLELLSFISKNINTKINLMITSQSQLDLPILNQDHFLSEKLNQELQEYKKLIISSDGIIIASPEYNGSVSGALKNFIDWLSRDLNPFSNKKIGLVSISPSPFGGLRGLMHLRDIMMQLGAFVYPGNVCISKNGSSYSEQQMKLINNFSENFSSYIS